MYRNSRKRSQTTVNSVFYHFFKLKSFWDLKTASNCVKTQFPAKQLRDTLCPKKFVFHGDI